MLTHNVAFVSAALLAIASTGRAQTKNILGRDNAGFARALYASGYADLSEGLCGVLNAAEAEGKADFYEMLEVKALAFDLRLERARRENDPLKRRDTIVSVLADENAFIQENSRTKTAEEVRNRLPEVYFQLGETLVAAIRKEQDPALLASLRAEGVKYFDQALTTLRERVKKFSEQLDAPNAEDSRAERQHMVASYNLARTQYFYSLLFPQGDPERKKLLESAVDAFLEFGLDYDESMLNYDGSIYQGLAHRDLGAFDDALLDFDSAIALRETWERTADGRYDMPSDGADLVSAAVLQKVLLLVDRKEYARAEDAAEDFFRTIPDAQSSAQGLAILAAQADARVASGNISGASDLAQRLVEVDPAGPWGARGRDVLAQALGNSGSGVSMGTGQLLRVAETMAGRGEHERALDICEIARRQSLGTPEAGEVGADALYLVGAVYGRQRRLHEASVAWDEVAERYPQSKVAADALWSAVNAYLELHASERRPFYQQRVQDRMRALATRYPKHPFAAYAQLVEGQQLESEGKFIEAVNYYKKMSPGAAGFEEGQYRAGKCLYSHARALIQSGKTDEAQAFLQDAEVQLRAGLTSLQAALDKTLDREVQKKLNGLNFSCRAVLAQLLLDTARAGEVQALFADAEQGMAADSEKLTAVWTFRIQALQALGKLDEAVGLFDALRQKQQDSPAVSSAAAVLARALDQAAVAAFEADPKSTQGEQYYRQAAQYYVLSVAPQIRGDAPLEASEVDVVAKRLYVLGLHFNRLPESANTFVDWGGKPSEPELWEQAARIYEAELERAPSYRAMIDLGRTYGLLQRWQDAAQIYARLFDQESLVVAGARKLNSITLRAKPELIYAYLEWGVAEHELALIDKQADRLSRAAGIFERMAENTEVDSRLWWQTRYHQARAMVDRGDYKNAAILLREVKRTTNANFDQGRFGFQKPFEDLALVLSKKVF